MCGFGRDGSEERTRGCQWGDGERTGPQRGIVLAGHRNLKGRNGDADNLTIHGTDSRRAMTHLLSEMSDDAHDNAFDLEGIGLFHHNRLHGLIGGLELDDAPFAAVGLDRRVPIHQGNDGLTVPGHALFLHHDYVSGEDSFVPHGVALHAQGKGLSTADHARGDVYPFSLGNGFNRFPGRDDACHQHVRRRKGLQGDGGHAGNPAAPVFVANDRPARRLQLLGELCLREVQVLTGLTELGWPHR